MMNAALLQQDGQYTVGRETRWREGIEVIVRLLREAKYVIRVLDVGCGDCSCFKFLKRRIELEHLSQAKLEYYAVDNNPQLSRLLNNSGVLFKLGDFTKLTALYKAKFFDVIIASEVLEHVTETDAFVLSLKEILKETGYIYLTTPNLASWHGRLMLLLGFQPFATEVSSVRSEFGKGTLFKKYYFGNAIMHIRSFTLPALIDFLNYHGYKIDRVFGGGYRRFDDLIFTNLLIGLSPILKVILRKQT